MGPGANYLTAFSVEEVESQKMTNFHSLVKPKITIKSWANGPVVVERNFQEINPQAQQNNYRWLEPKYFFTISSEIEKSKKESNNFFLSFARLDKK